MATAKKTAGKKQLGTYVHIDGEVYGPGDDVPAEVAERITNPKAWEQPSAEGEESEDSDN